jgi:uncharacterized protein (DUF2141 family)
MLKIFQVSTILVATLASLSSKTMAVPTAKLTIVVNQLPNQKGEVCMRIYAKEQGFPQTSKGVVQSGCTKITGRSVTKEFYGLKYGTYAVALFHDENGDGKLNTNFLGIPREGFGISNNPPVRASAPKFTNSSFTLRKDTIIKIGMKYI